MAQAIDDLRRARRNGGDGRVPPHNIEAEESVLGAMLLSRDAIAAATEVVSAGDFYKPAHGHVFDAISTLYGMGEPADPVTVAEELNRAGLLDAIGGMATLVSLQARTPATSNAARYARIIEEHALLRRLIGVAGEIAELGYGLPDDVTAAVDRAESMVFEVAQRRVADTMVPMRDLLEQTLDRLEQLYEKGDAITGVPTGYHDLDRQLAGLQPSSLVIVGARPAMGKCVKWDTRVVDPATGALHTVAEIHRAGSLGVPVRVLALDDDQQLHPAVPSAFVDDGIKPVYRVRTRLGREVATTLSHPFLTTTGWRPLAELAPGDAVAVPSHLPVAGWQPLDDAEVALVAYLLSDHGLTGVAPALTAVAGPLLADARRRAADLGLRLRPDVPVPAPGRPAVHRLVAAPATGAGADGAATLDRLRQHGLAGCAPRAKRVPDAVFRLPQPQLAFFLDRLFAAGGAMWDGAAGARRIGLHSLSEQVVRDVAHLLLRFGVVAAIRRKVVAVRGERWPAFELAIDTPGAVDAFLDRIRAASPAPAPAFPAPAGTLPGALPDGPLAEATSALAVLDRVAEQAPMVLWDEIVAIDYDGEHQVYDLTVPGQHNFVAGDVCVHNTSFALNMAAHAALEANRPVLFFSLEMSHLELSQRLLCAEARVDSKNLRVGKLTDSDWTKISHAVGRLGEAPIYIDDNPQLTVMEIRSKARRLKSRLGDLGMVVVDYLQLMTGRNGAENRQVEVSEISRGLKILARELEAPVVGLSQLSRNLEMRADKRPMLADLRESGCLTADSRILRADTGAEVTMGELLLTGERDIPVWSLGDDHRLVPAVMTHVFPSGTKPVFELQLASGRRVTASANHPFRTLGGWTRLDELVPGSRVAVPRAVGEPAEATRWVDDEVVMLAHLIGDGCFVERQPLHYTSNDPANLEAVEKAAVHFGVQARYVQQQSWWHLYLPAPERLARGRRNPIAAWLDSLGLYGRRSGDKFVPAEVFGLEQDQIALFLRHLWATDGCVWQGPDQIRVYYASKSRRLVDDVQLLLLRCGVSSRIKTVQKTGYEPNYHLHVTGAEHQLRFLTTIGVHGRRGDAIPDMVEWLGRRVANTNVDTVPREVWQEVREAMRVRGVSSRALAAALGTAYCGSTLYKHAPSRERLGRVADVVDDDGLRRLAESDLFWDQVVAIRPKGEEPVFDATVVGTHNFIANGIAVHNSIEQDADVVMFIYRDEVYNPESADRGTAEVLVAKHRSGPTGVTRLAFLDHYTRFANMARDI